MSAPPSTLLAPPTMPTMVSRLPKFGFRPTSGAPQAGAPQSVPAAAPAAVTAAAGTAMGGVPSDAPLTNGSIHQPPTTTATTTGGVVKYNGLLRMPAPLSISWTKKGKVGVEREGVSGWKNGGVAPSDFITPRQQLQLPPPQQQPSTTQRWLKKPNSPAVTTVVTAKGRGFGFGVASAASPQPSPKGLPVLKNGAGGTRTGQKAVPGLSNGTKPNLNGHAGTAQRMGALRPPASSTRSNGRGGSQPGSQPGSRPSSPLFRKQPAGRSQSSDSLRTEGPGGSGPSVPLLSEKDRLRSRSLNQVQRQQSSVPLATPSASSPSVNLSSSSRITRSYSLNRAADRGSKEQPQTPPPSRLLLPRTPVVRSSLAKHIPWQDSTGLGGLGGAKSQGSAQSALPVSNLKKPLLPSTYSSYKASALGANRSRPSLIRQPRPLRVTPVTRSQNHHREVGVQGPDGRRNSLESPSVTPSTTENSPGSTPEAAERVAHGEMSVLGETLEDMSLSSTSSLERNDTSQEYMDDFDNLGNGGVGILLLSTNDGGEDMAMNQLSSRTHDVKVLRISDATRGSGMHSFLEDGIDWTGMRLSGDHLSRLSRQRRPSQPDYQDQGGSSLDLSPSDSCGSGGTYMWDEEGLEPLGGAVTTATTITTTANTASTAHHIGSYDSDLNSIDLLNNLDSCELDDDDLMLDDDLPEDTSLHSDGDGITHMAQWRMPQLCWGTQDIHDNSEFQSYHLAEDPGNQRSDKEILLGLSTARSTGAGTGLGIDLDLNLDLSLGLDLGLGLDVEELADNCSAVRAQLEDLQRVLLQEGGGEEEEEDIDDTLTTDTLSPDSPEDSNSSEEQRLNKQVAELLCEVQQLREDVRRRDRTIAQLTQQLTVPAVASRCHCRETEGRRDGHTQTSVAEGERVSLHQASQTPWREHTGFPPVPFLSPPWQYQRSRPYRGRQRPCIPHCGRQRVEKLVHYFSDKACLRYYIPTFSRTIRSN